MELVKKNAEYLLLNGWQPRSGEYGSNMGQSKYLYVTTGAEDALWYAEEKGCNTILIIENLPLEYLKPDPEDEAGYTMKELLNTIIEKPNFPRKFVIIKPLDKHYFKLYNI